MRIQLIRVNADHNLFELETNSPLSPSITTLAYCTCQRRSAIDFDGSIGCGGTTIDCSPDFELDYVGAEKCNILLNSRQSKRSLGYSGNTLQKMFDLKEEKLRKKGLLLLLKYRFFKNIMSYVSI